MWSESDFSLLMPQPGLSGWFESKFIAISIMPSKDMLDCVCTKGIDERLWPEWRISRVCLNHMPNTDSRDTVLWTTNSETHFPYDVSLSSSSVYPEGFITRGIVMRQQHSGWQMIKLSFILFYDKILCLKRWPFYIFFNWLLKHHSSLFFCSA
jgi:hypothetical protein